MSRYFNAKRLLITLKRELLLNKANILILFISLTFLSLLMAFLSPIIRIGKDTNWEHAKYFAYIIMVYVAIAAGNCFSELNSSERKTEFLMLPSSTVEKYLAKFIYTTIVLFLLAASALLISGTIVRIWNPMIWNKNLFNDIFASWAKVNYANLPNSDFFRQVLLLHSAAFFGAVYFKKMELAKSFLALIGVAAAVLLFDNLILNHLPPFNTIPSTIDHFSAANGSNTKFVLSRHSIAELNAYRQSVSNTRDLMLLDFVPLLLWTLSFLRLKEAEVNDGV